MSTLVDIPRTACFRDGEIVIVMESGAGLRFPVSGNPRLAKGTSKQLTILNFHPSEFIGLIWMKIFHLEESPKETTDNPENKEPIALF
jgi:hypothetical protein